MSGGAVSVADGQDFLAWEERQPERWEKLNGVVHMMVGGTMNHSHLCRMLANAFERLAPKSCAVYAESAKLKVGENWFYPDAMLVCPRPRGDATWTDQAVIVAEVDSPSNSPGRKWIKLAAYQTLPSLQAVLHLSQTEISAQLFRRQGEQWVVSLHIGPDAQLELPGCTAPLTLGSLYDEVELPEPPPPPQEEQVR